MALAAAGWAWPAGAPAAGADEFRSAASRLELVNLEALGRAVGHLSREFGRRYPRGQEFMDRLGRCRQILPAVRAGLERGDERALVNFSGGESQLPIDNQLFSSFITTASRAHRSG